MCKKFKKMIIINNNKSHASLCIAYLQKNLRTCFLYAPYEAVSLQLVLTPINSYLHDDDDDVLMEGGDGQNDDLEPLIT